MIAFLKENTDPTIVVSVLVAAVVFVGIKFVAEVLWEVFQRGKL